MPSINNAVGITPGNGVDSSVPGLGENLSQRFGTNYLSGLGDALFEVFDHGTSQNILTPIDLIGFANNQSHPVGRGIVYLKDRNASNTTPSNSR